MRPSAGLGTTRLPQFRTCAGADHRRFHVTVAQQLLCRSDVVAVLQQVRRKRILEGMTTRWLRDSGLESSHLDRPLQDRFVQMVPAFLSRDSVGIRYMVLLI